MALRTEIEATRDQTLAQLADAHDYFAYTKGAWRTLQLAVERDGMTFRLNNQLTGSAVSERDLLARAQRYVAQELASATLQQFVAILEGFIFNVTRQWLLAYPESLASLQLTGRDILNLPDKTAIVNALIDKKLMDVFYDRPANWFEFLRERVAIKSPSILEAQQFAEMKATRDILVHGQGIANGFYVGKAAGMARAQAGQPLDVPEPYHQQSWELVCKLVRDIGTEMAAKA